jgi:hypothetical protein
VQEKKDSSVPLQRLYRGCHAELGPGEVKRTPRRGPLVGLFLRCPACGALGAHLAADVLPDEEPDPPERPEQPSGLRLVRLDRSPTCRRCGRSICVADGVVRAV